MGWGQPVAPGKRVHSSTQDNCSTSDSKESDTEELSESPPYCSKRARELSPELELESSACSSESKKIDEMIPDKAMFLPEVECNGGNKGTAYRKHF